MSHDYFLRINRQTDNRMWVNNPTVEEGRQAIAAGAVGCTTNPTYSARILKTESATAQAILRDVVRQTPDPAAAAHRVQQELCARIMPLFLPIFQSSNGQVGHVSVQGDPHRDHDADHIIQECLADRRRLGPNHIAKIPVTQAGIAAIEAMVHENIPVIATEIFSLAQAVAIADVYQRAARASGHQPAFFVTHITGIYDEYLEEWVKQNGIAIAPEIRRQAGCLVARQQYRLMRERGYPGILLGGGVRAAYHFTELLGSTAHVTINYSTIEELNQANPPIEARMNAAVDPAVVAELLRKLPAFRQAYEVDGLAVEEFAGFGPVQHFANIFRKGWDTLVAACGTAR